IGETNSNLINKKKAIQLLGTMQGGYNIEPLINMLDSEEFGNYASEELSKMILIFDFFYDVERKANNGNKHAKKVLESWANGEWFLSNPEVPEKITLSVFKVTGETNTDDLSPAPDAWSRPDIPLHSLSMLKNEREGINPDEPGEIGPLKKINELKNQNFQVAYVGDVVGTGSSRKSATNSILWFFGNDIPYVPNKKNGGYCIGNKIAPIFFNTMEDSGALPIEMPVEDINMGDIIDIYPYQGITKKHNSDEILCKWSLKSPVILDSVRARGRINLIIGKSLTNKARKSLKMGPSTIFRENKKNVPIGVGYTLAQKMVGRACGLIEGEGILPGNYCEPIVTTVG
ncbi:MAG: aconitate hydratase B, partial [Alphaproteobacteria bacterium]|nr:aconitate hydratase B [Alphaproteobacteria bacterium]